MERQRILGGLVLLAVTAAAAGLAGRMPEKEPEEFAAYEALVASTPAAELEGDGLSPDGRFEVRTVGKSDLYVSGVVTPENLQIVEAATGDVLWEDTGYLYQSALWSPDSAFLALAYGGRTWADVKVFETETWTSWDFTLPDGSPIPEYTFLPEDWGAWQRDALNGDSLRVTVGRGGDGEEQHIYRCSLGMEGGQLAGSTWEQTAALLSDSYDFDHDGEPEATELVTIWEPESEGAAVWYEVQVRKADGSLLWTQGAAPAHGGWISVFAYQEDGADYLLRYLPTMYQGYSTYSYQVFSLDENGGEEIFRENSVQFDVNWGSPQGHDFDPAAIAAFMEDANDALSRSRLLLSTDEALAGIDPEHPRDDLWWLVGNETYLPPEDYTYDETLSLEENLRALDAVRTAEAAR